MTQTPKQKAVEAIRECRRYGRTSEDCLTAALASLEADGWKLMPREATGSMIAAGVKANDAYATEIAPCSAFRSHDAYTAMFNAAPEVE